MADARTAIALNRRTEQAEFTQLIHDFAVKAFVKRCGDHAGEKLVLRIGLRRLRDHPFIIGELRVETKGIVPLKRCEFCHVQGLAYCCEDR
jgi:hypothetical protein